MVSGFDECRAIDECCTLELVAADPFPSSRYALILAREGAICSGFGSLTPVSDGSTLLKYKRGEDDWEKEPYLDGPVECSTIVRVGVRIGVNNHLR